MENFETRNLPAKKEVIIRLIDFYNFVLNNQDKPKKIHEIAADIYGKYAATFFCDFLNDEELTKLIWSSWSFMDIGSEYEYQSKPYSYLEIKNRVLPLLKNKYEEVNKQLENIEV